ncbi:hypothetical protein [Nesterenkonia suensis]
MAHQKLMMGEIGEAFAKNIRAVREVRRIGYDEIVRVLAERGVVMNRDGLYRIETMERHARLDEAAGIAVALNVPLMQLMTPGHLAIVPNRPARWARAPRRTLGSVSA